MKAVLDANVLFPTILREILCDLAAAGAYQPLWSDRILREWTGAAGKLGTDQASVAEAEAALLRLRFPGALVATGDEVGLGIQLPDAGDLHVVQTALDGQAKLIVTMNLRDFPRHALERVGMNAVHPDEFLSQIEGARPGCVAGAVNSALSRARAAGGVMTQTDLLRRSRLPRLSKALKRRDDMSRG